MDSRPIFNPSDRPRGAVQAASRHGLAVQAIRAAAIIAGTAVLLLAFAGCGYSFQRGGDAGELARRGVRRIYIAPLENRSYKAGADHVVYNELLRALASFGRARLVQSPAEADAILRGTVVDARYVSSAATYARNVFPRGLGSGDVPVASEYTARLTCAFRLERQQKTLWSASFDRSRPFVANNQLGAFGTTSALINESEFDRALREMAESMMADVNESMLAMF
jgi:hypothetical protein